MCFHATSVLPSTDACILRTNLSAETMLVHISILFAVQRGHIESCRLLRDREEDLGKSQSVSFRCYRAPTHFGHHDNFFAWQVVLLDGLPEHDLGLPVRINLREKNGLVKSIKLVRFTYVGSVEGIDSSIIAVNRINIMNSTDEKCTNAALICLIPSSSGSTHPCQAGFP